MKNFITKLALALLTVATFSNIHGAVSSQSIPRASAKSTLLPILSIGICTGIAVSGFVMAPNPPEVVKQLNRKHGDNKVLKVYFSVCLGVAGCGMILLGVSTYKQLFRKS